MELYTKDTESLKTQLSKITTHYTKIKIQKESIEKELDFRKYIERYAEIYKEKTEDEVFGSYFIGDYTKVDFSSMQWFIESRQHSKNESDQEKVSFFTEYLLLIFKDLTLLERRKEKPMIHITKALEFEKYATKYGFNVFFTGIKKCDVCNTYEGGKKTHLVIVTYDYDASGIYGEHSRTTKHYFKLFNDTIVNTINEYNVQIDKDKLQEYVTSYEKEKLSLVKNSDTLSIAHKMSSEYKNIEDIKKFITDGAILDKLTMCDTCKEILDKEKILKLSHNRIKSHINPDWISLKR